MTPQAVCPKCGAQYVGWALIYKPAQCDRCGEKLEVKK